LKKRELFPKSEAIIPAERLRCDFEAARTIGERSLHQDVLQVDTGGGGYRPGKKIKLRPRVRTVSQAKQFGPK
jgi:hypothetical protein